ncbi:MAG: SOS response-associated peptidase [Planctomycetes bacterium]|nr:SOS response-associated peptidase [Planctomycetota bacterium]
MPGRLIQDPPDLAEFLSLFGVKPAAALIKNWQPRYNLAPHEDALCVVGGRKRKLVELRWGLVPSTEKDSALAKKPINARSETVDEKKMFRESFVQRRCIVPATGWYEWTPGKLKPQPHCIRHADGKPLAFAGLYDHWDSGVGVTIDSFLVITCQPNAKMAKLHHRMGCILDPADYDAWLDPKTEPDALRALLRPCPDEWLTHFTVSNIVSDKRNKGKSCIKPGKLSERY